MAKKKKWKKRLKKLAKAALIGGALYGGAKLLGSRGKGAGAVSTAGQAVGVDRITPKRDYITKKITEDIVPAGPIVEGGTGGGGIHQGKTKPFQSKWHGVAPAPPGILNPYRPPSTHRMRGMNYKGGGIAKRGTGVALKKGGRVKSMGIAKRGGGIAKR